MKMIRTSVDGVSMLAVYCLFSGILMDTLRAEAPVSLPSSRVTTFD